MERIDLVDPVKTKKPETNPFYNGPGEFLCAAVAKALSEEPHWKCVFGDSIDAYKRMDYSIRELPAMRIYINGDTREFQSWFITGDIKMDMILPASVRRNELQQVQDTLTAAMNQQFRRGDFFDAVEKSVPGLNELGKRVTTDKSLGFEFDADIVPLTQLTLNFRLDLREWDKYLESTSRELNSPFEPSFGDLKSISTVIQAMKEEMLENEVVELEISSTQKV